MEEELPDLTVYKIGAKAKSKQEINRILSTEGGIYLPPWREWNYNFVRDIISGDKNVR